MHPIARALLVAVTTGGLLAGGRAALLGAPGQNAPPAPLTATELAQVNAKLAAQATSEEQALQSLKTKEQTLQATIAQLRQEAQAYQQEMAQAESGGGGFGGGGRERGRRFGGDDR